MLVNPLDDLETLGGTEEVLASGDRAIAAGVSLNGGERAAAPVNTAPDRRYLWLDVVGDGPVSLMAGTHTLSVAYAGSGSLRRVVVDGFLIQQVIAQRLPGAQRGTPSGIGPLHNALYEG